MDATRDWLHRIAGRPPDELREYVLPVIVPGAAPLSFAEGIIATAPQGPLQPRVGDASPLAMSILRYLDVPGDYNVRTHERLAFEISSVLSLLADRRVLIPNVVPLRMQGSDQVTFLNSAVSTDLRLLGPMPPAIQSEVHGLLSKIGGLSQPTAAVIGAAARLHQSAVQLLSTDIRSSYLLLVAGIEVLSRVFGQPPTDWSSWDRARSWEVTFERLGLTADQKEALRKHFLSETHLRLKGTFRDYASTRLPDSFWSEPWTNWMYTLEMPRGRCLEASPLDEMVMRDVLPQDRPALSIALGKSYDLRSNLVHQGALLDLGDVAIRHQAAVDMSGPLPIAILRSVLRQLIRIELDNHASPYDLPEWRLVAPDDASYEEPFVKSPRKK